MNTMTRHEFSFGRLASVITLILLRRMIISAISLAPARRSFLATSVATGALALVLLAAPLHAQSVPATDAGVSVISPLPTKLRDAVRPFRINIPEAALVDLRQRVAATRWPERETVTDQSQGVQLAKIQALVRYWGTDYDWRKVEAKLNSFPQFVTNIDGLDIHFIWLTNTAVSSARLYWESKLAFFAPKGVPIPAAVSVFPDEIYAAPKSWTEKAYPKLIYYNRLPKGRHFSECRSSKYAPPSGT